MPSISSSRSAVAPTQLVDTAKLANQQSGDDAAYKADAQSGQHALRRLLLAGLYTGQQLVDFLVLEAFQRQQVIADSDYRYRLCRGPSSLLRAERPFAIQSRRCPSSRG